MIAKPIIRATSLLKKDFFPTSKRVSERMLDWVTEGGRNVGSVLEPHGGEGDLVKEIIARTGVTPRVLELSKNRVEKLRSQGIAAEHGDFLRHNLTYDTILMNPPFSEGQAKYHILHAMRQLNPGGRGVSVVPARDMLEGRPVRTMVETIPGMKFLGLTNMKNEKVPGKYKSVALIGFQK